MTAMTPEAPIPNDLKAPARQFGPSAGAPVRSSTPRRRQRVTVTRARSGGFAPLVPAMEAAHTRQCDPERRIHRGERRPRALLLQDRNLLPQGKVLQGEVGAGPEEHPDRLHEQSHHADEGLGVHRRTVDTAGQRATDAAEPRKQLSTRIAVGRILAERCVLARDRAETRAEQRRGKPGVVG